jgi:hypothetical protein
MKWTKTWLEHAQVTDDPEGDFVRDARRDPNLPDFKSLSHMRRYLRTQNACPEAIALAPTMWRRLSRWRDRRAGVWSK